MKAKSMILILIALGCGLVASIGVSQVMVQGSGPAAPVEEKADVLIASTMINIADRLTEENVKVEQWPDDLIPEGAVTSLEELEEMYSKLTIVEGQVLVASMLAKENEVRTLKVPDGYRATSIKVSIDEALSGLLQAGDRVDITGFFKVDDESIAKTFLRDIQVFAVNDKTERIIDPEGKSLFAKTVSLLVTPEQVQKILVAKKSGHLHLSLRSYTDQLDKDEANDKSISLKDIIGDSSERGNKRGGEDTDEDEGKSLDGFLNAIAQAKHNYPTAQPTKRMFTDVMTSGGTKRYTWTDPKQPPQISDLGGGFSAGATAASVPSVPSVPTPTADANEGQESGSGNDRRQNEPTDG